MQELERMIKIYHTAFVICLVLGILFLIIAVFMFFKFDIKKIVDMRTGRGAKKTIQKMEEINARTGKLRQDMVPHTPLRLNPDERITYPVTAANPTPPGITPQRTAGQTESMQSSVSQQNVTSPLANTMEAEGSGETELLSGAGNEETTILYQESETTVLSENMTQETQQRKLKLPGAFKIEKEIIWIHTNEIL